MKNNIEENLINEVKEVLSSKQNEIREEKKVIYDKTTQQFSIKIPKSIAMKAGIREDSLFDIILEPNESIEKIEKSRFVIYLKEDKDGKGEKAT